MWSMIRRWANTRFLRSMVVPGTECLVASFAATAKRGDKSVPRDGRRRSRRPACEPLERRAVLSTMFVAINGSDSNPGTSVAPWRTLQYAVDKINPGDTIQVRSGTYAGFRVSKSGTETAPKAIQPDVGAAVIINAPSVANKHQSNIEVEQFGAVVTDWVISGFEIASGPRYGIDLRGTKRIVVQNNNVHHSVVTGIFTAFSDNSTIRNNSSSFNGEHGIYHSNSGDYPSIQGNKLFNNFGSGIHINGDASQKPGDGLVSYATIENNIIYENGRGGGSAINLDGVMDSVIRNNLAYSNHASGISLYAIDGAAGSSRNQVLNNTFVMASDGRWVVNMPKSSGGRASPTANTFRNNILYTPRTDRGSVLVYSATVAGFSSDNNVVVGRFSTDGGKSTISLAQWQRLGYDKQSIIASPAALFVDVAANNYRLRSGSAAIDTGATLALVTTDISGVARPQGPRHDIGCHEYVVSAPIQR